MGGSSGNLTAPSSFMFPAPAGQPGGNFIPQAAAPAPFGGGGGAFGAGSMGGAPAPAPAPAGGGFSMGTNDSHKASAATMAGRKKVVVRKKIAPS